MLIVRNKKIFRPGPAAANQDFFLELFFWIYLLATFRSITDSRLTDFNVESILMDYSGIRKIIRPVFQDFDFDSHSFARCSGLFIQKNDLLET